MSHTPFRKVRAKRVLEVSETPDELAFDSVQDTVMVERGLTPVQRGLAALAISTLGLVTVGGVVAAASPTSSRVDVAAVSTDKNSTDITRAVPGPDVLAQQQTGTQPAVVRDVQGQTSGSLSAFAGRSTVTRSAARGELSTAVAAQDATIRQGDLDGTAKDARLAAADANAKARADEITVDQNRIKAEQARIAAEIKANQAKLAAAKAQAAAAGKSLPTTPATPAVTGAPAAAPVVTGTVSAGGGATPIAAGQYSVGAYWGEYGSWSRWHTGQDLPAPVGTPVRAVADGVASSSCAGCQGWAGSSALVIHHASGSTLYAHMDRTTVSDGQVVKAGQVVGYVGMKGRTFGPHLHFEYYPQGTTPGDVYTTQDPRTFLLTLGVHL